MADESAESHLSQGDKEGRVAPVKQHHRMAVGETCNGMGTNPNGGSPDTAHKVGNSKVTY